MSALNDAPVLDNTGTMTLTTITEDQTSNAGNTVASIIASAGGDRITDVDSGAVEGIAVTGLASGNGTWQYSIDGGASWIAVGAVSDNSALLLRDTDRLRFVPDAQNADSAPASASAPGTSTGATAGQHGTKVDASTNGGTTRIQHRHRDRVDHGDRGQRRADDQQRRDGGAGRHRRRTRRRPARPSTRCSPAPRGPTSTPAR